MEQLTRAPCVGLVMADRTPKPILARALLEVTRDLDLRDTFDRMLHDHLSR
ncbi:hypothetical protein AB0F88_37075 [Streptosporangium sp. NPDC023963]|uniref:hypothetical protein n=1 Tax=Streptosporangium sp. NPDC023963 TaxID=3155608 RepID=UPI00342EF5CA